MAILRLARSETCEWLEQKLPTDAFNRNVYVDESVGTHSPKD